MKILKYKTLSANKSTIVKKWYQVDATGQVVGRLASKVASILRGKHKPDFTPHIDGGDYVIITNADQVYFKGKKEKKKQYISHTGYPGGQKSATPSEIREKDGRQIVRRSVEKMLCKNKLRKKMMGNLFIYTGSDHPHVSQKPATIHFTSS